MSALIQLNLGFSINVQRTYLSPFGVTLCSVLANQLYIHNAPMLSTYLVSYASEN